MLSVRQDFLNKAVFMDDCDMAENEYIQSFSKANGQAKTPHAQETGFQILDIEKTIPVLDSKLDQSPRAQCILRISEQQRLRFAGNAIKIDQEEEIWADLERRIHTP
jgi:hypothetical protein